MPKRRSLRNGPTPAEKILWISLRNRQILNTRFLRQYSIGQYIVDFYSPEVRLVIELDGEWHIGRELYDENRQGFIERLNIEFLRFTNEQILGGADKVVETITAAVKIKKKITLP